MYWTEVILQAHLFKHLWCVCICVYLNGYNASYYWCQKWNGYYEINCHFNYLTVEKCALVFRKISFGSLVGFAIKGA